MAENVGPVFKKPPDKIVILVSGGLKVETKDTKVEVRKVE